MRETLGEGTNDLDPDLSTWHRFGQGKPQDAVKA